MKPLQSLVTATPQTLGEQIAFLRVRKHMSQAALARQAQVSHTGIQLIEADKGIPKPVTLVRIFQALEASVSHDEIARVILEAELGKEQPDVMQDLRTTRATEG